MRVASNVSSIIICRRMSRLQPPECYGRQRLEVKPRPWPSSASLCETLSGTLSIHFVVNFVEMPGFCAVPTKTLDKVSDKGRPERQQNVRILRGNRFRG